MPFTYDQLKDDYATLWERMHIRPEHVADVKAVASRVIAGRDRYMAVSGATGVPWFVVGILHQMECGGSWRGCLMNGDPWNQRTIHVPRGKGPWPSWEAAAIDALRYDGTDKITDWCPEALAYALEKFNGFGSRQHGVPSAYLWSFTDQHERGKYVSDGVWNSMAISGQPGGMAILKELMALDPSVSFTDELHVAAVEFPKTETLAAADLAYEDHTEAHAALKLEDYWYAARSWVLKKLGWPVATGGAGVAVLDPDLSTVSTIAGKFSQVPMSKFPAGPILLLVFGAIIVLIVVFEAKQYKTRVKVLT